MKNEKRKETKEERVKLKPVLGIAPGVYLSAVYAFIILLILFFVFVFPGIKKYGSIMEINSLPDGASVVIDGLRVGHTPYRGFVEAGEHEIEIKKSFFLSEKRTVIVGGGILGTIIFPRKQSLYVNLELYDEIKYVQNSFLEFSGWSHVGESTLRYPVPAVLSEVSEDFIGAGKGTSPSLDAMFNESLKIISAKWAVADFIEGYAVKSSDSLVLNHEGIVKMLKNIIHVNKRYNFLPYLNELLPKEISFNNKYSKNEYNYDKRTVIINAEKTDLSLISAGTFTFREIPAGILRIDEGGKRDIPISSFYMMETEIRKDQYELFLKTNPEWRKDNADALMAQDFISKDYLADISRWEGKTDHPVAFVSRYAAEAFCGWLESEYSEQLSGYTVRLPTEWEWEYAALGNGRNEEDKNTADPGPVPVTLMQPGDYSLRGMGTGLWEWCSDWFFPNSLLFYDLESDFDGTVAPVRGGSWANNEKIAFTARGHQPPSWCTPFLGFRPVLFPDQQ